MEDIDIKANREEDIIFNDQNGKKLEIYDNDATTNDITTGVNIDDNDASYKDVASEYGAAYEEDTNVNHNDKKITMTTPL